MPHPGRSVLVVEDDSAVRECLGMVLRSEGFTTLAADSVAQAMRTISQTGPDIAIIDLHLPDGSGYELALRLWQQHPRLPVIIISGNLDATDQPTSCRDDLRIVRLAKPFPASVLLRTIDLAVAAQADRP